MLDSWRTSLQPQRPINMEVEKMVDVKEFKKVEFEVHELAIKEHHFNVCYPKDHYTQESWCVGYEVQTRNREDGVHIEFIRCESGHMEHERMYSEATKTFLVLCEYLKARGWKL